MHYIIIIIPFGFIISDNLWCDSAVTAMIYRGLFIIEYN